MADTVGDLIDKLTIANLRIWHLEDKKRELTAIQESTDKIAIGLKEVTDKVSKTNRQRNDLIDQINASLHVLVDKAASKDSTFQLTAEQLLGTGKNKFYKTEDR